MMSKYLFKTDEAEFYEHGIDLLRSGYTYSQIEYSHVYKATLKRGHIIKNWVLLLSFGIVLILTAVLIILPFLNLYVETREISVFLFWRGSRAFGLVVVIFLFFFGIYSVVLSLRFAVTLRLYVGNRMFYLSLEKIEKEGNIEGFSNFLNDRVSLTHLL
jgi:hypothetical protein